MLRVSPWFSRLRMVMSSLLTSLHRKMSQIVNRYPCRIRQLLTLEAKAQESLCSQDTRKNLMRMTKSASKTKQAQHTALPGSYQAGAALIVCRPCKSHRSSQITVRREDG